MRQDAALGRGLRILGGAAALGAVLACAAASSAAAFSPAEVYRRAAPSVVFVFSSNRGSGLGATGTGSIIREDGLILTNHHVVTDDVRKRTYPVIQVYFKPSALTGDHRRDLQRPHRARLLAHSKDLDLALLRVEDPPSGLPSIPFGDSARVEVGEPVAAIGHPTGGGLWTLTTGTISGIHVLGKKRVFQTEAALNPGNSGGPLLDADGRLIGVNTSIIRTAADGTPLMGLNFSVKSEVARSWLGENGVALAMAAGPPQLAARLATPTSEPSASAYGGAASETPEAPKAPETDAGPVTPRRQHPPRQPAETAPAPPQTEPAPPRAGPEPTPPGATPSEPRPAPTPDRWDAAERELEDAEAEVGPKPFRGPGGERMYGVPDRTFDLEGVKRDLWERSRKNADSAFDELDGE